MFQLIGNPRKTRISHLIDTRNQNRPSIIQQCGTYHYTVRPVVVEVMIDTSDQFGVSVSLRDACLTDRNHTVFVFFGTMDVSGSSGACSLKQKMAGTISAGVSQMFFANTCSLSLGPDERYCVVATLEGDDGNLIGISHTHTHSLTCTHTHTLTCTHTHSLTHPHAHTHT